MIVVVVILFGPLAVYSMGPLRGLDDFCPDAEALMRYFGRVVGFYNRYAVQSFVPA